MFYLKEFRLAIYGKQLSDLSRILYSIEEKLRAQGKTPEVFFQRESDIIPFKSFAEIMQGIDSNLKCEDIDLIASRMDTNADGLISKNEFMNTYHEYLDFNEFKRYLIRHAQESGKQIQDLFYITSMDDGMRKDDFFKFCKSISKDRLNEKQIEYIWNKIDHNGDGKASKTEMAEIMDITQKELYHTREYQSFKTSVIMYCEDNKISLRELFDKFKANGKMNIIKFRELVKLVDNNHEENVNLLKGMFDKDLSNEIDYAEFRDGIIGEVVDGPDLIHTIKRILLTNKTTVDDIFQKAGQSVAREESELTYREFCKFLDSLHLRLSFIQKEKIFEMVDYNGKNLITKRAIRNILFSSGGYNAHFARLCDTFAQKFLNHPTRVQDFNLVTNSQAMAQPEQFVFYAKKILGDIQITDSDAIAVDIWIFQTIDSAKVRAISLKDIDLFCNSGRNGEKYMKEISQQQTVALRNLKAACVNKRIDLISQLSRFDNDRNGIIPDQKFHEVIRKNNLLEDPGSIMAVTSLVQTATLHHIDVNLLQIYLNKAEDPSKFAYFEILREMIVSHAAKNKIWLKQLFDNYSEQKRRLTPARFADLLRACDMRALDTDKLTDAMKEFHPTSQDPYMTFYDFLSIFGRNVIEKELMLIFTPFATLYSDLKTKVETFGNTISKHFYTITGTGPFSLEIINFLGLAQGNTEAIRFCTLLEDPLRDKFLDKKALEFVETYLPKNFKELVQKQQPQPQQTGSSAVGATQQPAVRVPADPSGLTYEELEKVKAEMIKIDGIMRKSLSADHIEAMKRHDPLKTGKVTDEAFLAFLVTDLKLVNAAKRQYTLDLLKRYAKKGQPGLMDYDHLWRIISLDLASKKPATGVEFRTETVAGDNSTPAVPTHLMQEQQKVESPVAPALIDEVAEAAFKHPVRMQILNTFRQLGMSKDNFMNLLFPGSARELEKPAFLKILMEIVKGLDPAEVDRYLMLGDTVKDKKFVQKDKLRNALFHDATLHGELKDQNMDQQIQSVFNAFRTGKDGLTMNQVGDACKRLGIYLSKSELDQLYRDFKRKDSIDMSEGDFNKLVKHEFSKDVISSRVIGQRLTNLLNSVLVSKEEHIVKTQLRAIFERANVVITEKEFDAVESACEKNENGGVDKESFYNLIVNGSIFEQDNQGQMELGSAVMKLRTSLSSTFAEQISNFRDLPNCFVPSFTEDLYQRSTSHLPTSCLKPILGDTKSYYSNLYPPISGQESNVQSRYTKYVKLSRTAATFSIELSKATGVPIPSDQVLDRHFIVGRELRVFLFEENRSMYLGNCLNLKAKWSQDYEDRVYFDTYNLDKEEEIIVKVPAQELTSKDKRVCLMFELVMFVKRNDSRHANAMTAGFCKLDLLSVDSGKTFHLDLITGSPQRDKSFQIAPGEVLHKRKGFMPTLASLFEGKIKSQLHLSVKPFKFNPSSPTEFAEQVELLPDLGVYHAPQIKVHSVFRQCLGRDAFSFRGAVTANLNLNLGNEIYVNSYCAWFCIPSMAIVLSHFWNNTVEPFLAKARYEAKLDTLKDMFTSLYACLSAKDFCFEKSAPTNDFYGDEQRSKERLQILKTEIDQWWMDIQTRLNQGQKLVPARHLEAVAKLEQRKVESTYTAFNLQELMDDDFGS